MASGFKVAFDGRTVDLSDLYMEKINFATYDLSLWVFGDGANGKLGTNSITSTSSPIQTMPIGTNWSSVEADDGHTAAIKTDGTLWAWGRNAYGQLGDNTSVNKSSPIQTISLGADWLSVSCGSRHTAAIKTDGTLWLWGFNGGGELGDGTTTNRSSPVQTISLGTDWLSVSCGFGHTAAIKTDGTLWSWGWRNYGQLGDNTANIFVNISSPVQTISGGTDWASVSCGSYHTAAMKTDGTLWLWGSNTNAMIGDNTLTNRSSPVQTSSKGSDWASVSCGGAHTAAIKIDGTLWAWGYNYYGQLGNNTRSRKFTPTLAIGTGWASVSCGGSHTAAIKTDGTLWAWGYNSSGQLGDNTGVSRSSPVQTIKGGSNWTSVICGGTHTAGITSDTILP